MLGIKADELILRTLTAAAELKSWLRWHLPPILRVLPHKQIKQLYRFLSPLHFTPMTLHLHLSFVSLSPATPLPWQEAGCHLYANTCEETEEKKCFTSFEKQTASQSCRRPSIWLDMAFREIQACCLQSWAEGWQGQWAHCDGWCVMLVCLTRIPIWPPPL